MDGHECEDVVKYQQEVFLPVMKECMSWAYFEISGFVKENSHFERRAVAVRATLRLSTTLRFLQGGSKVY